MTKHYDPRLENPLRFNRAERSSKQTQRKTKVTSKGEKSPRTQMTSPSNRYRWSAADGGLIPLEEWEKDHAPRSRLEFLSDAFDQPVVSPIDGSKHNSKKGYIRHVHAHGKTIVGNESLKSVEQNRPRPEPVGVTLRRICERLSVGG